MQSNSENNSVTAAVVAALVTRKPATTENPSHNAMRVYLDKLRELVPHCPKNRNVSKLELIQHVIDYINDLQETLQNGEDSDGPPASPAAAASPISFTEAFSHLSFSEDGNPREINQSSNYDDLHTGYSASAYTSDGSSDYDSRGSSPINNSDTDYSSDECSPTQFSQQFAGPYYTNSLTMQVSSPTSPITHLPSFSNQTSTSNDPRRIFRKGYGLPAHLSG